MPHRSCSTPLLSKVCSSFRVSLCFATCDVKGFPQRKFTLAMAVSNRILFQQRYLDVDCILFRDTHKLMEFKFNFEIDNGEAAEIPTVLDATDAKLEKDRVAGSTTTDAKCITAADVAKRWENNESCDLFNIDKVSTSFGEILAVSASAPISNGHAGDTDLISAVYEGGLKVWECTTDLLMYLQGDDNSGLFEGKNVLDVGCGVGLLGVYAMKYGRAAHVTFQDFNESVIMDATGPTAISNFAPDECSEVSHAQNTGDELGSVLATNMRNLRTPGFAEAASTKMDFVSGDWSVLRGRRNCNVAFEKYDIIVSSETIYNEVNYGALHDYLDAVGGRDCIIYMSAKSHYFGVGGSVHGWVEFVKSRSVFGVTVVKEIDASLKRYVLCMSRE